MKNLERLERAHKRLYRSIQNDLLVLEKNKNREIQKYEKVYHHEFLRRFSFSSKEELLDAIQSAECIFVADFHPFSQSQKTFLRLLREIHERDPSYVIALECAQSKFQDKIEYYLAGEITLEELKEEIEYEDQWPFPWLNYSAIFHYAKISKIPVVALNISALGKNAPALAERDRAAAQILAHTKLHWPEKKIFVLYGELHIARKHLPKAVKEVFPIKQLLVYQNEPSLYWQVAKHVNSQKLEVLRHGSNEFCIMNAVPWVKLQSYLDWFEGGINSEDFDSDLRDISSSFRRDAEYIAGALGLKMPVLIDFDIQSEEATTYLQSLLKRKNIAKEELPALKHALNYQRLLVLPKQRLLYLPSKSNNTLAEAAALALHFSLTGKRLPSPLPKKDLSGLILRYCLGYFGSKILNPKRKCNEQSDILFLLRKNKTQKSLIWAKKNLDWIFQKNKKKWQHDPSWRSEHGYEAARIVGYILGDRLFTAIQSDSTLLPIVLELFQSQSQSEKINDEKLLHIARSLPKNGLTVLAKNEKL